MATIIFTRHHLTEAQMDTLPGGLVVDATNEASGTIEDSQQAKDILREVFLKARQKVDPSKLEVLNFVGVFPPIVRETLIGEKMGEILRDIFYLDVPVVLWEAHNIYRAAEGQKPEFEFVRWCKTGEYRL